MPVGWFWGGRITSAQTQEPTNTPHPTFTRRLQELDEPLALPPEAQDMLFDEALGRII